MQNNDMRHGIDIILINFKLICIKKTYLLHKTKLKEILMNTINPYDKKEKLIKSFVWLIQYFNTLIFPILITIILYNYYKNKSKYISEVCKQAINYSLSLMLYFSITLVLGFFTNYINIDFLFFMFLTITILLLLFSCILYLSYPFIAIKKSNKFKLPYIIYIIK